MKMASAGSSVYETTNVDVSPESVRCRVAGRPVLEVLYENRSLTFSGGGFTDGSAPFAVHVYKWRTKSF